jgi:tight adherence protein B
MLDITLIVPIVSFVFVAGLVGFVALKFRDDGSKASSNRLDVLIGKKRKEDQSNDILKKSAFDGDKKSMLALLTPKIPSLERLFEQADCHIKPGTLFAIGVLLAVLGTTASWLAKVPWFLCPLAGLVLFTLPFLWLLWKRSSRMKKFAAQMSDAMELLARALRAGQGFAAALHVVAEEMPAPIAEEFGRVYEEQNLGITLEDSLRAMAERVPNLDLRFFVTSVAIQRQTGGDMAEILDKIGHVIRERYKIMGQVKALTGEGRLSGIVLLALPFSLFGFMLHIKPDYVEKLWTDPLGIKMSVAAIVLQILGAICIKKIVDIKV